MCKEDALWLPESRVLVVAEALVGAPDLAAPGETVGVHPIRRLLPPSDLEGFADRVEHLLLGHGDALHGEAARDAMRDALAGSRAGCRCSSAPRRCGGPRPVPRLRRSAE